VTKPPKKINIEIYSFGFKYYQKVEAPNFDLRFDLRNKMKNPQSHLSKGAIGKDKVVIDTILKSDQNKKLIKRIDERIKLKVKDEFNIKKFRNYS